MISLENERKSLEERKKEIIKEIEKLKKESISIDNRIDSINKELSGQLSLFGDIDDI